MIDIRDRKQIWHCCTPKSGSTFLETVLRALLTYEDCVTGRPVPTHGLGRYQDPCVMSVTLAMRKSEKTYFSGHLHTRLSEYFEQFFLVNQGSLGGGVIIQTRDIADTIVSMADELNKLYADGQSPSSQWVVSLPFLWPELNNSEKFLYLARHYAYWHADFLISWSKYSRGFHCTYEEVTSETPSVVSAICDFFNLSKSSEQIEQAIAYALGPRGDKIRFNKGISGRGEQMLCAEAKAIVSNAETLVQKAL